MKTTNSTLLTGLAIISIVLAFAAIASGCATSVKNKDVVSRPHGEPTSTLICPSAPQTEAFAYLFFGKGLPPEDALKRVNGGKEIGSCQFGEVVITDFAIVNKPKFGNFQLAIFRLVVNERKINGKWTSIEEEIFYTVGILVKRKIPSYQRLA